MDMPMSVGGSGVGIVMFIVVIVLDHCVYSRVRWSRVKKFFVVGEDILQLKIRLVFDVNVLKLVGLVSCGGGCVLGNRSVEGWRVSCIRKGGCV